jgi:hypothetical protein
MVKGNVTVTLDKGWLDCQVIRFWIGDAVLKTQLVTNEGSLRRRSVTRIRRGSHQESVIERRLVRLFEAIDSGS